MAERPTVNNPRSRFEWGIEAVALLALAACIGTAVYYYGKLPATIPTHFGIGGVPDDVGSKGWIFLLPAVSLFIYALLTVFRFLPGKIKPVQSNPQKDTPQTRQMARELLSLLKAETLVMLYGLTHRIVQVGMRNAGGIGRGYVILFLAVILLTTFVYVMRMSRLPTGDQATD